MAYRSWGNSKYVEKTSKTNSQGDKELCRQERNIASRKIRELKKHHFENFIKEMDHDLIDSKRK